MTPRYLARILQNRSVNVKDAEAVSALQDMVDNLDGTCFYVACEDGRKLRVTVSQYRKAST